MLDAGDEYLLKYLGMAGSSARPSDTTMPDSWDQAATYGGKEAEDRKRIRDMLSDPKDPFYQAPQKTPAGRGSMRGDRWLPSASTGGTDTQVAVKGVGGSPGQEYIDPNKGKKFVPPPKDFQRPGSPPVKKADDGDDYGNIAAIRDKPGDSPNNIRWPRKPGQKTAPGSGYVPSNKPMGPQVPFANRRRQPVVAHHEPEGETIMEKTKKSFKDITNRIPGYYDGKPAPLGFPMEEPPKMVNGKHPDLVDGKKVSNRYNRLDPISAKSMPKTGNPHIDKKVAKAQKKAK